MKIRYLLACASTGLPIWQALLCNAANLPLNTKAGDAKQVEVLSVVQSPALAECINADWQQKALEAQRFTIESQQCIKTLVDARNTAHKTSNWSDIAKITQAIISMLEAAIFGSHQSISGIGIKIAQAEDKSFLVEALSTDSPAYKAGMKPGDTILGIDNQETRNLSIDDVIKAIRGRPGSEVSVRWKGGSKELTKTIKRAAFSLDGHRRSKDFAADYAVLFESYLNLNMANEMLSMFPEYKRLLVEEYGENHHYLARAYEQHALAETSRGNNQAALASINRAIEINSVAYGKDSEEIAASHVLKSDILIGLEGDAVALESLADALSIYLTITNGLKSGWIELVSERIKRIGYRCNFGSTSRIKCAEFNASAKAFADKYLKSGNILAIDIAINKGYSSLVSGDIKTAARIYRETIDILKTYHPADFARLIPAMSILAGLYANDSVRNAEAMHLEILSIIESHKGRESKDYIEAQISLAEWYAREGIREKALNLFKVLELDVAKKPPADKDDLYHILGRLGSILKGYVKLGKFSELAPVIDKVAWFSNAQPDDWVVRINLHIAEGFRFAVIERVYGKALEAWIKAGEILALNKDKMLSFYPDDAVALNRYNAIRQQLEEDIAAIHALQGNYESAIDAIDRAIEANAAYADTNWVSVISLLVNKARFQIAAGDLNAAQVSIRNATEIELRRRKRIQTSDLHLLSGGIAALNKNSREAAYGFLNYTDSLLANLSKQLSESTADIRRQLVQETASGFSAIYYDYQLGEPLDRAALHARLNLHGISIDVERVLRTNGVFESRTSPRSFSSPTADWLPLSVEATSRALPKNAILVEFQKTSHFPEPTQFYRKDSPLVISYMALVLTPEGRVKRFNLGPAADIDQLISAAITATTANNSDSLALWKGVSTRLFSPILSFLDKNTEIFVSPDSEISRVPFNALPEPEGSGKFLNESYRLRVLSSGKDLLRLGKASTAGHGRSVVMANPDYGALSGAERIAPRVDRDLGSSNWKWLPLKSTAQEGRIIADLLGAQLLDEKSASVQNLFKVRSPRVLHIATHGYFMGDIEAKEVGSAGPAVSKFLPESTSSKGPSPLERSGLVLAGANYSAPWDKDSGYLTASEASRLNLTGTEIVVLSACSTGEGDLLTGEGVYGLQRSLLVAGARSTLLSLWRVDDAATAELMSRFYARLKAGEARSEALVNTQREFREGLVGNGRWKDPYYWAAWQLVGDWQPIKGL
jgi:CHAT domain-containing protein/tetratricopeptide (TPR) repeat protein